MERVCGCDHPYTLKTRYNLAYWTGEAGDRREALRLFAALLPDVERVLGHDHPDTLKALRHFAEWTIRTGDHDDGCRRLREGLVRSETRFGSDHPTVADYQMAIREHGCGEP